MIIHYLKISLRNLWKYKTHSLISALCLAVGIVCYILVSMYCQKMEVDLPDMERRIRLEYSQDRNSFFSMLDAQLLEDKLSRELGKYIRKISRSEHGAQLFLYII